MMKGLNTKWKQTIGNKRHTYQFRCNLKANSISQFMTNTPHSLYDHDDTPHLLSFIKDHLNQQVNPPLQLQLIDKPTTSHDDYPYSLHILYFAVDLHSWNKCLGIYCWLGNFQGIATTQLHNLQICLHKRWSKAEVAKKLCPRLFRLLQSKRYKHPVYAIQRSNENVPKHWNSFQVTLPYNNLWRS